MKRERPKRIAQVWAVGGIVSVEIHGEWPAQIQLGEWVYSFRPRRDGKPQAAIGRRTSIEFVSYCDRRRFTCADVPDYLAGIEVSLVKEPTDGTHAIDREPAGRDERDGAGAAPGQRPRRHFGKKRDGRSVPDRRARAGSGDGPRR